MNNTFSAMKFWLNDQEITFRGNPSITLLDFLRYSMDLRGTKIGCREGDCGACVVILGRPENGAIKYRQIVSCLTPIANVSGCHVVTIEGINRPSGLTLVQQLMIENGGTQCGFCTVGFVVSMTAFALNSSKVCLDEAIKAVDGNICRCTGYHSIIRALNGLTERLRGIESVDLEKRIEILENMNVIPNYFSHIIREILNSRDEPKVNWKQAPLIVGGGTDLYVQQRHTLEEQITDTFYTLPMKKKPISITNQFIHIPANTTVSDLESSSAFLEFLPEFPKFSKLISSTPIRNLATVAGNFVNASSIGDLSILFLSLKTILEIQGQKSREIPLKTFFKGYKQIDLQTNEIVTEIRIERMPNLQVNFEKVSKRTHLDIASVNSAISLSLAPDDTIEYAAVAVGGVSPIPLFLNHTSEYLLGKVISEDTIMECLKNIDQEISPISDVRGSAEYKRHLAKSLFLKHFVQLKLLSPKTAIRIFNQYLINGGNGHA